MTLPFRLPASPSFDSSQVLTVSAVTPVSPQSGQRLVITLTNAYNVQRFGAPDYFTNGSWSSQGTPRALTWSFVPDGVLTPGLSGQGSAASNLFASMDSAFAAQGGRAVWTNRFAQCFARWQQLTGLTYTRITVGGNDWDDGAAWEKSWQVRPMRAACKAARIKPAVSFHVLRHTWASLTVMNGAPLLVVAKNLGHSSTRMVEKHYGHLAPSFIAEAIRDAAPRFGLPPERTVTTLRVRHPSRAGRR